MAEKKTKKKSPINDMNSHLKNTKRRDDSIESDSDIMKQRIPKKKGMKSKLKSQGGRFELEEDKCKFKST